MALCEPLNLDHHLGGCVLRRRPNIFKLFYKYEEIPNVFQLSAGLPNQKLFPIDGIEALAFHHDSVLDDENNQNENNKMLPISPLKTDIDNALQYGQASGIPELRNWISEFTQKTLPCHYSGGFRSLLCLGNTDGWYKTLQVLSNEWLDLYPSDQRQGIIVEEFTYSIAVEAARVRGLNVVSVEMDDQGLIPIKLAETLEKWDFTKGKRPHLLYTVSIGQNPTGATATYHRRKEIYEVCRKYDLIIVEDEPYWFMQFDGVENKCYLDVDVDGRVVRLDSFSKSFAPGARLGYITAQPRIIQRIFELTEEATQQPSGFTQLVMAQTLHKWGHNGWLQWLSNLRAEYEDRRNIAIEVLQRYSTHNGVLILDFKPPAAGMFVWIKVRFDNHPLASQLSALQLSRAFWAFNATHKQPVLVTPGYFFAPSLVDAEHMAPYIRISYAPSLKSDLKKETVGLGRNSGEFWDLTDLETMLELVNQFPES